MKPKIILSMIIMILLVSFVSGSFLVDLPFDENITDASGNNYNSSFYFDGRNGYDFRFYQGADDIFWNNNATEQNITYDDAGAQFRAATISHMNLDYNMSLDPDPGYSIILKGAPSGTGGVEVIMGSTASNIRAWFYMSTVLLMEGDTNGNQCYSTTIPIVGEHIYIFTVNKTICQIYVDGVPIGMTDTSLSSNVTFQKIGSTLAGKYWNGSMNSLLIINRSLSYEEVVIYNQTGNYSSGARNWLNNSIEFDGEEEYISVGNLSDSVTNQYTVSYWGNLKGNNTDDEFNYAYSHGAGDTNYFSYASLWNGSSEKIVCDAINTTGGRAEVWSSSKFSSNQWVFVACDYNTTHSNIYVNGVLENSSVFVGGLAYKSEVHNDLRIGQWGETTLTRGFNGSIDDFQLRNNSLTALEIYNLFYGLSLSSNMSDYTATINYNFSVSVDYSGISGVVNCSIYTNNSLVVCPTTLAVNNESVVNCSLSNSVVIFSPVVFRAYCYNASHSFNDTEHTTQVENLAEINFTAVSAINGTAVSNFSINFSRGQFNTTGTTLSVYNFFGVTENYYFYQPFYIANYTVITTNLTSQTYAYAAYVLNSINFTFIDEETKELINFTNVTYELISTMYSSSNHTTNGTAFESLLSPGTYTIRYDAVGYDQRFYYLNLVDRNTYNLSLYLLNSTQSDAITATVFDLGNRYIEGAVLHALRYNIDTNLYDLVSMVTTGVDGEALLYLQKNTEFYKFYIYFNDVLVQETIPNYIKKDNINFQIDIASTLGESFDRTQNTLYNLSFDNSTNDYIFAFIDENGLLTQAKLEVYKFISSKKVLVGSQSLTAAAGTLTVNINPVENNTKYLGQAYLYFSPPLLVETLDYYLPGATPIGIYAVFLGWLLTIGFAFIALYSPAIAALLIPIPMLMMSIAGLTPKELIPINIVLVLCGWILAFFLGRHG